MTSPLSQLKDQLAAWCQRAKAEADATTGPQTPLKAAYARGLADALELVETHSSASGLSGQAVSGPSALHHASAQTVMDMDLDPYPLADLTEAAFFFENQLMTLLEDDNTLPFDCYADLSRMELENIIRDSAEKICLLRDGR